MRFLIIVILTVVAASAIPRMRTGGDIVTALSLKLNGLRDGDCVMRYPISFIDTVAGGDSAVWDLSDVETGKRYMLHISLINDSLGIYSVIENGGVTYFRQTDDSLLSIGFDNNLYGAVFDNGEVYLTNDMLPPVAHGADFRAKGVYCDKLAYAMRGTSQVGIDASGIMIMPEGDTLRNVVRVHSRRTYHAKYYPLDSVNAGITDDEYVRAKEDRARHILDHRRWYAAGYRYPVMEIRTLQRECDGVVLQREVCYSPIASLNELECDYENEVVRNILEGFRNNKPYEDVADGQHIGEDGIDYTFTQNRAEHSFRIEYSSTRPVSIEFILADAMGIVYDSYKRKCDAGESGSITISYDGVTGSGSYVVYISTDERRYAEKFYR